jgi:hypothetical protein
MYLTKLDLLKDETICLQNRLLDLCLFFFLYVEVSFGLMEEGKTMMCPVTDADTTLDI